MPQDEDVMIQEEDDFDVQDEDNGTWKFLQRIWTTIKGYSEDYDDDDDLPEAPVTRLQPHCRRRKRLRWNRRNRQLMSLENINEDESTHADGASFTKTSVLQIRHLGLRAIVKYVFGERGKIFQEYKAELEREASYGFGVIAMERASFRSLDALGKTNWKNKMLVV